ncbi:formylglycine-generating enzyme family protein [Paractinoplanes rishiriensis]|nr:SUMF1/EgtB/PvdO family nonheme iron enzyme [Actinoplanes rishiriensis]
MTTILTGRELLPIPPGRVLLSDRRLQRRWQVDLRPFHLAAVPVTTNLRYGHDTRSPADPSAGGPSALAGPSASAEGRAGRLPAVNVSWWDAVRFCNSLSEREGLAPPYLIDGESVVWDEAADGYRLPTEAEWEHACRAGTAEPRYGELGKIAWYRDNSGERLHEPGGKLPNAWGLYDMLGNTWDWCWDVYDAEVYGSYRVLRGGGWFDEHWSCRASVRRRSHPDFTVDDVSFRLARSI